MSSLFFPAFYTSKYGYKMCLRIYLNGDGTGRGSHLSLFFVVMRGQSDALLKWPFNQKVKVPENLFSYVHVDTSSPFHVRFIYFPTSI